MNAISGKRRIFLDAENLNAFEPIAAQYLGALRLFQCIRNPDATV